MLYCSAVFPVAQYRGLVSVLDGEENGSGGSVVMPFEIIGSIENVETIAVGGGIREIMRLRRQYGIARWRKLKGIATVRLHSGRICRAEVHWYQAHGNGKKKMKIKRILD